MVGVGSEPQRAHPHLSRSPDGGKSLHLCHTSGGVRGPVYSIDPARVISETIDGETIVIDLVSGAYYSLRGSSAPVWDLASSGLTLDEIVASLEGQFDASTGEIRAAVEPLLDELTVEGVLELGPETRSANGKVADPAVVGREQFEKPVLEKFTDMQDFLLVDPIHEVGEAGWPHPKEA